MHPPRPSSLRWPRIGSPRLSGVPRASVPCGRFPHDGSGQHVVRRWRLLLRALSVWAHVCGSWTSPWPRLCGSERLPPTASSRRRRRRTEAAIRVRQAYGAATDRAPPVLVPIHHGPPGDTHSRHPLPGPCASATQVCEYALCMGGKMGDTMQRNVIVGPVITT